MNKPNNFIQNFAALLGAAGLSILIGGILLLSFTNSASTSVQVHIILGLTMVFIGLGFNLKKILSYLKSQKGKSLFYAIVIMSMHVYIIICINYISHKNRIRIDYTSTKRFTLSDKTKILLKNKVDQDITLIINENISEKSLRDLNELVNQLQYHSKHIKVKRYHPGKNPNNAATLERAYSFKSSHLLIVATDVKGTSIDKGPLMEGQGENKRITWFKAEQAIYNSILNTINSKRYKIYFVRGHGEPSITSKDRNKPNVTQLVNWLLNENYTVEEINLSKLEKGIPADCDVLTIINPTRSYSKSELEVIDQYLDTKNKDGNKGSLFIAMGANITSNANGQFNWVETGLERLLIDYGIKFNADMILETELTIKKLGPTSIYIPSTGFFKHPITEPFIYNRLPLTLKGRSRSLIGANGKHRRRLMGLITSSANSKSIIDLNAFTRAAKKRAQAQFLADRESKPHHLSIASAAPKKNQDMKKDITLDDYDPHSAKVIGIGNGAFLNTPLTETARDFYTNSIKWLTLEKELIGTGMDISKKVFWSIPENREWVYKEIIFYLMPLFWIFLGGIVWWRRKT